jgi:UDP-N-acetylmuramyl pentapeptide synthase
MDALLAWLDTHPIDTDFAFVKGSRGIRMERVLEHFNPA